MLSFSFCSVHNRMQIPNAWDHELQNIAPMSFIDSKDLNGKTASLIHRLQNDVQWCEISEKMVLYCIAGDMKVQIWRKKAIISSLRSDTMYSPKGLTNYCLQVLERMTRYMQTMYSHWVSYLFLLSLDLVCGRCFELMFFIYDQTYHAYFRQIEMKSM